MRIDGAVPRLDAGGDLRLGKATQKRPVAYQLVDGKRAHVPAAFDLSGGRVTFRLGTYDHQRPLVIDPVLAYSTYLGGPSDDSARGIAVDADKSAYIAGTVNGTLAGDTVGTKVGPNVAGDQDAFVAKLSPDGKSFVYVTYYGGGDINGPQADTPWGIALNSSNEAFVGGTTQSTDFPVTSNGFQHGSIAGSAGYVLKLKADGSLDWATYLDGSHGNDSVTAIAVDASGNPYVTGETDSDNFPTTAGVPQQTYVSNDAFVTKLHADGTALYWSTYLGGGDLDQGNGIAINNSGNPVVVGTSLYTGSTFPHSSDFPLGPNPLPPPATPYPPPARNTFGGSSEMFLASFDASTADRLTSTFLGGSSNDSAHGIATDGCCTYVVGTTSSNDVMGFSGSHGGTSDAIVIPVAKSGPYDDSVSTVRYIGTSGTDEGAAIATDPVGYGSALYVTGILGGSDLSEINPLLPASARSGRAFIAKLTSYDVSTTLYLSYLGGASQSSFPNVGTAVAVDKGDGGQNRFAAYFLGNTKSTSFPTKDAEQPMNAGGTDLFLAKVAMATPTIDSGPAGPVASTSATFGFSSTDTSVSFNCWVNTTFPGSCTSP